MSLYFITQQDLKITARPTILQRQYYRPYHIKHHHITDSISSYSFELRSFYLSMCIFYNILFVPVKFLFLNICFFLISFSSSFSSSFFEHSSKKQVNRSAKLRRIHLDREYWKRTNGRRFRRYLANERSVYFSSRSTRNINKAFCSIYIRI